MTARDGESGKGTLVRPGQHPALAQHVERGCKCSYRWGSYGRLHGVDMGKGFIRITTHPDCPEHALCQGFTAQVRAERPHGGHSLYCNVHKTKNCPQED